MVRDTAPLPVPGPLPPRPLGTVPSLLRHGLACTLMGIGCALSILGCLFLLPWRGARVRWSDFAACAFGPAALRVLGVRLRVLGRDHLGGRPAIYLLNHTSTLDTYLSFAIVPPATATVVKAEVRAVPILGQAYALSGHLLLHRGESERAREEVDALGAFVRGSGLSIWLLPEGTRSKTGALGPFKKGFVHLALATGLPVVPVVAFRAHERWPLGGVRLCPGKLTVQVGAAIPTAGWSAERAGEHAEQVRAVFAAVLEAGE